MAEKKIIFDELIKITATEESPGAIWQERKVSEFSAQEEEILRRPGFWCQMTNDDVGLLRMTAAWELSF